MRPPLERCPACGGEMIITQQSCTNCETVVSGRYQPNIFSKLSPENLKFLENFVKNRGNVKEMERDLGWSYWTIRSRINEMIEELGFETRELDQEERTRQRRAILGRLDRGEISVNEAVELLAELRSS